MQNQDPKKTAHVVRLRQKKPQRPTTPKKVRHDWDAVERDYRTGKFTLRELEAKHGVANSLISRNAKAKGWTQDLGLAIRQATNAALIGELVRKEVSNGTQAVRATVDAVAEVNKQVIMGHRKDIAQVRDLTMAMAGELATVGAKQEDMEAMFGLLTAEMSEQQEQAARKAFADLMRLHSRIQSAKALAETLTKLHAMERAAFGLDADPDKETVNPVARLTDAERAVRLVHMLGQLPEALVALRGS